MHPDLEPTDRRTRERLTLELAAVCQLHGARVLFDPHDGLGVVLIRGPVRLEWWWHWAAEAGGLEAGCAKAPLSYPTASPAQWGEALVQLGRLLSDEAFHASLAIVLTRIRPEQALALRRQHQRALVHPADA